VDKSSKGGIKMAGVEGAAGGGGDGGDDDEARAAVVVLPLIAPAVRTVFHSSGGTSDECERKTDCLVPPRVRFTVAVAGDLENDDDDARDVTREGRGGGD